MNTFGTLFSSMFNARLKTHIETSPKFSACGVASHKSSRHSIHSVLKVPRVPKQPKDGDSIPNGSFYIQAWWSWCAVWWEEGIYGKRFSCVWYISKNRPQPSPFGAIVSIQSAIQSSKPKGFGHLSSHSSIVRSLDLDWYFGYNKTKKYKTPNRRWTCEESDLLSIFDASLFQQSGTLRELKSCHPVNDPLYMVYKPTIMFHNKSINWNTSPRGSSVLGQTNPIISKKTLPSTCWDKYPRLKETSLSSLNLP